MKGLDLDLPLEEARAISNDKIIKEIEYFQRDYAPAEPAGDIEPTLRATVVQLSERSQSLEHYLRTFPKLIVRFSFNSKSAFWRIVCEMTGCSPGQNCCSAEEAFCAVGGGCSYRTPLLFSREEYQFLVALSLELSLSCLFLDPAYN